MKKLAKKTSGHDPWSDFEAKTAGRWHLADPDWKPIVKGSAEAIARDVLEEKLED